jgi:hypothetical protein
MGSVEAGALRRSTSKSTGKAKVSRRDIKEEIVVAKKESHPIGGISFYVL